MGEYKLHGKVLMDIDRMKTRSISFVVGCGFDVETDLPSKCTLGDKANSVTAYRLLLSNGYLSPSAFGWCLSSEWVGKFRCRCPVGLAIGKHHSVHLEVTSRSEREYSIDLYTKYQNQMTSEVER